jgi:hypothetical protein
MCSRSERRSSKRPNLTHVEGGDRIAELGGTGVHLVDFRAGEG